METKIIKGDLIKDQIFSEVKTEIASIASKYQKQPGIAFIGFTTAPLSKYNIPFHVQLAQAAGFITVQKILADETSEAEMYQLIDSLNADDTIQSIVILQPLPAHLNPIRITNRVLPVKEVEGFHPQNMLSTLIPDIETEKYPMCLPLALFEMIKETNIRFEKDMEWVFVLDDEFIDNSLTIMVV